MEEKQNTKTLPSELCKRNESLVGTTMFYLSTVLTVVILTVV